VRLTDAKNRTLLILAAILEPVSPQSLQQIIDAGADVQALSQDGLNALDHALQVDRRPIIDVSDFDHSLPSPKRVIKTMQAAASPST